MMYAKSADKYILVLEKGEELTAQLTHYCKETGLNSAWLQGLGGALSAELGFYNLTSKDYEKHQLLNGPYEVSGLQGNIGVDTSGEIVLHMHATLADSSLVSQTGHIHNLIVGGTLEILLTPLNTDISRQLDRQTGLNLINLPRNTDSQSQS